MCCLSVYFPLRAPVFLCMYLVFGVCVRFSECVSAVRIRCLSIFLLCTYFYVCAYVWVHTCACTHTQTHTCTHTQHTHTRNLALSCTHTYTCTTTLRMDASTQLSFLNTSKQKHPARNFDRGHSITVLTCCSVLQRVTVRCSVLQCVAVCCSVLQH